MAKFYSDIELEELFETVAEALNSRDEEKWISWIIFILEQLIGMKDYSTWQTWIRTLIEKIEKKFITEW